jgi:hypothetical protein
MARPIMEIVPPAMAADPVGCLGVACARWSVLASFTGF